MLGSAVMPVTLMYAEKVKFIAFTFQRTNRGCARLGQKRPAAVARALPAV